MLRMRDERKDYTIPKIKRELKPSSLDDSLVVYYTIPKIKRKLKPTRQTNLQNGNYTIPKIKRELKPYRILQRIL